MMTKTNYHSHCSFCDGKAPMEEFFRAAIAEGFVSYGVSSHAPLPFDTKWTLDRELVPAYLDEFGLLKEKYKEDIELYVGMEIDYLDETSNPSVDYFQQLPLDYRIGSVHLLHTPDGRIVDVDTSPENFREILQRDFRGELELLVAVYYDASMKMAEAGGFDFVGHTDKISYNAEICCPGIKNKDWYKRKLMDFLALVAEKGVMLEINAKAYPVKGCFFPNAEDFHLLREFHIPVLVNSDAHRPELVNAGREEALLELKRNGFQSVRTLVAGKWEETGI